MRKEFIFVGVVAGFVALHTSNTPHFTIKQAPFVAPIGEAEKPHTHSDSNVDPFRTLGNTNALVSSFSTSLSFNSEITDRAGRTIRF